MSFDRKAWIKNAIRRASYRYPPRYMAKQLSRVSRGQYKCAICKEIFRPKDMQMDHVLPVENPEVIDQSLGEFVERMFPETVDGFQYIDKMCHYKKSALENALRREVKAKAKTFKIKIDKRRSKR